PLPALHSFPTRRSSDLHEPTVTMSMLKKHRRGLICLSGCQGSLLACTTVGGKGIEPKDASYRRGLAVARMFKSIFGKWFFIEVRSEEHTSELQSQSNLV